MRTVLRLGTAMAITVLVAGVAANCALPPYEAGGPSSGSGGGAASSGSGKTGTSSASSSASGQGGDVNTSSSSSGSESSSSGGPDGGDGGPTCADEWVHCDIAAVKTKPCMCPGQLCSDPQCSNNALVLVCDPAANTTWQPHKSPPDLFCCPESRPCDVGKNEVCLVTPDPANPGSGNKGSCVVSPCPPGPLPNNCPSCVQQVCMPPKTCSSSGNTIMCGN